MNKNMAEKKAPTSNGMISLVLNIVGMLAAIAVIVAFSIALEADARDGLPVSVIYVLVIILGSIHLCITGPILFVGIKILKPNEALVLTLFGKYYGTLKDEGMYFVNPFCAANNPASAYFRPAVTALDTSGVPKMTLSKKISLKSMTLNNDKQKINDLLGTPVIIGIVVIWRVVDTAKAVFNVENYADYLSIQCDSALRNIIRLYPYDASNDDDNEKTLRSSSQEIALRLKNEIQQKVENAGLEIQEARITHLAYAPEIAAAMLQRQQASAIIDARQMIVDGAVGMVEMALAKLSNNNIIDLDEERKAQMISNLLVVLCSSKEVSPVVNSGTLY
ncbi:MAG: SPFH domain-containing protein [Clostridiales bacterium]|jgi:regulator of protease activity HflC (stomatin/prohibitin superfamily)|nr:SPFH domain-containing protein [Clostridiales bacterium]